ncbi:MAG: hypothetical protein HUU55_12120 [Myxococcales bacterium]|nr:hypothetical protein [Myxococcales bacterium]
MYIESQDYLNQPATNVYPLVRDEMPKLVPYMPNVAELAQLSYERESSNRVRIVNRWRTEASIPAAAAKFIPAEAFTWIDRAFWKDDEYCVDYELEGYGWTAKGTNYFTPEGDGTLLKVTADVTIHPEKFKIPKFLFNTIFPLIEGAIKKAIQPNLTSLANGLRGYFASK